MKKNVVYIVSHINKALAFEWVAEYLDKDKFNISFILLNPGSSDLEEFLKKKNVPVYRVHYTGKKNFIQAVFKVSRILKKVHADIAHAHLFDASLIGMMAAKLTGIKRRIYTRHYSTYHHVYFSRGVLYDKLINHLSTDIVAISQVVKDVLVEKEKVKSEKTHLIYHGFLFENPDKIEIQRIETIRNKYGIKSSDKVIGVISRFIDWKGIEYCIDAFKEIYRKYPDTILVLANAAGNYEPVLDKHLAGLPAAAYRKIVFENDIYALYKLFNYYVHVPVSNHIEAFGQTYVEALSMKIPCVFTLSGIAVEFIEDKKNALVVPYKNSEAIGNALEFLINNEQKAIQMAEQGRREVLEKFSLTKMIQALNKLHE